MGERAQAEVAERVGHTPGPWTLTPDVDGFWIGNDGENAARVYGFTDHPRNIANAHLVAAAPDLHDVLSRVRVAQLGDKVFIGVITDDGCWSAEMTEQCGRDMALDWKRDRDAAIAKAEGR